MSEQASEQAFSVYLLFSEHLQFRMKEVYAVFAEQYPTLADNMRKSFTDTAGSIPVNTAEDIGVAPVGFYIDGDLEILLINNLPGGGRLPKAERTNYGLNSLHFAGAERAWDEHVAHLVIRGVSVTPGEDSIESRFDKARYASALAAVFASDPTCLGVLFNDQIHSPNAWREETAKAVNGEFPTSIWVSPLLTVGSDSSGNQTFGAFTRGMSYFNDHEVYFPETRVAPVTPLDIVFGASNMLLAGGHVFQDSDTIKYSEDLKYRIRLKAPTQPPITQTPMWCILHPECDIDEESVFGPRTAIPRPPGYGSPAQR